MDRIPANKLTAAINSVVKAGAKFSAQLHGVAFSCLALIEENGDVRPLQKLHDTIGGRVTKGALVAWAKAFGKVSVTYAEGDDAKERPQFKFAKAGKSDLEGAAACPVLDYKPEASGKSAEFDFAAKVAALLKAAEKHGAHLQNVKAYQLIVEAEKVLTGENVVAGPTKAPRKAKAEPVAEAA